MNLGQLRQLLLLGRSSDELASQLGKCFAQVSDSTWRYRRSPDPSVDHHGRSARDSALPGSRLPRLDHRAPGYSAVANAIRQLGLFSSVIHLPKSA